MLVLSPVSSALRRALAAASSCVILLAAIGPALAYPLSGDAGVSAASPATDHLVISELMTGGASASDEFVELYNPSSVSLSVEGLELVYVTASGATITRKATWPTGTAPILAGGHLLIANDAGIFSAIADARYANGLAAAGGSVALRVVGASAAIDAVGWGTAASTWLETRPAPAPTAGSSLERLPGGAAGSGQDTNDNLVDFAVLAAPDPQNVASTPISTATPTPTPSATPALTATPDLTPEITSTPTATSSLLPTDSPSPSATPIASATATPTPLPTPAPSPISIAAARLLPDGATAMIEGVAISDGAFTDGGGYLFDGSAGIAVLVSDGTFARGQVLRITGNLDDRYSQRTIRVIAADVITIGPGVEPIPEVALTGLLGEALEGHLVQVSGSVTSSLSTLSGGIALDLDDGSGAARVVVGTGTGVDTAAWERGAQLTLVGVLGQRDSSGTGTAGYRLQPRDTADLFSVRPPATPSPTPTSTPNPDPTATASPAPTPIATATPTPAPSVELVTISAARSMPTGAHLRIRGVVTLPSGLLDGATAVVQDPTGGILIRLGDTAGALSVSELAELDGIRSTKSGMLSLRVTTPALRLGAQADPDALRRATGALGEGQEALLVVVRGAVTTAILRSGAGSVSFSLNDGSGPIRVTIAPKSGISLTGVTRGAWLELRGVLGQETTGREADKGYRIWPRRGADLTLLAAATAATAATSSKPSTHAASNAQLSGAASSFVPGLPLSPGSVPLVALALPTASPRVAAITDPGAPDGADEHRPQAAALLGVSLGMALLAGALGLRGRRRTDTDQADEGEQHRGSAPAVGDEPFPSLSLVPIDAAEAPDERRILPPI